MSMPEGWLPGWDSSRCFPIDEFRTTCRRGSLEYAAGRPQPVYRLQPVYKVSLLRARLLGMDGIATGHYARIEYNGETGRWLLKKARDASKDQTYVLYALTQDELAHTLFPLGNLLKTEVRRLAEEHGLVNARKPDSQDICFVPDGDYADFLERVMGITVPEGDYIDTKGRVLGRHKGHHRYTVGQRKGLGVGRNRDMYSARMRGIIP